MAGQKHLHELLKEDQEPFHLKTYLADRRCLLKSSDPPKAKTTSLQVQKRRPIVETSSSTIAKRSLCKQACFFAFHDSPDVSKSPLPGFLSPAKSPCRTHNGSILLHIPARTATLLLEAAVRIQKQQSSSHSKSKAQIKNVGFGLFSSILKKLKDRNKNKKCEIRSREIEMPQKSGARIVENMDAKSANEVGFSCSCNNSRLSSAGWSESNEERSLDTETSTSCSRSEDSEELDCVTRQNGAFNPCESRFCSSPLSPFRFSLQRSPSSGRTTPIFSSPAASPRRHKREDKENYEGHDGSGKIQLGEDEEKEQSSPASVLDPPFDNEEEEGRESGEEEDYDVECSFAIVQRAKEQLLYKLRRFEKLAELDPVELEKRMMEELDDEDEEEEVHPEDGQDNEFFPVYKTCSLDSFVTEVFSKSDLLRRRKVPADMRRLVSDLISEENREMKSMNGREVVLGSVCKKLDSWKEVEYNTIDMMVELDFRSEFHQWKKWQEQREEAAMEIELAIFGVLVEELTEELN